MLKNSIMYNKLKEIYYHYFAYKKIKHRFDIYKKVVSVYEGTGEFKFKLYKLKKAEFTSPLYLNTNISFFLEELPGYLRNNLLKKDTIILDCGAFEGAFSIYASKKVGDKGKIVCFEPGNDNLPILKENLRLNNIKNVKIIKAGVWSKKEVLYFKDGGLGGQISKDGNHKIKATDLDSELKRLKIPFNKVSFVKMDIEGAEIEAIDGMKELLAKGSPHLAIATYHERDGEKTYMEVEKKLKEKGYKVKTGYPKHLTTWAWKA